MTLSINSSFVGRKSKVYTHTIDLDRAIRFSAGIYETSREYYDDRVDPMPVHPMYVVAITWNISGNFAEFWDVSDFPIESLLRQVHYIEEIEWYQPLYVGQTIYVEGEVKAIIPHIAGTLLSIQYIGADKSRTTIFRETSTALLRGVQCDDKGQGKELVQPKINNDHHDAIFTDKAELTIQPYDSYIYDACSEIRFPIHTSYRFAEQLQLPGPIYQGTAVLSRVVNLIKKRVLDSDQIGFKYIYTRYSSFITEGNILTINMYIKNNTTQGIKTVLFEVENENNVKVLKDGILQFAYV